MASLSDILRGALSPNEYNMGRDLDEEERRQIEELRAQGIYVPQERKVSPFRYGAGAVRQQNLADMRAAMQPEQDRRMKELMIQRGRGSRDAAAKELRQRQRKGAASQQRGAINRASSPRAIAERKRMELELFNRKQAFADQLKAKRIADEQRRQQLSGLPTMSAGKRYDLQEGDSIPYASKEAYVEGATPRITDTEKAELAVLQRDATQALLQGEALTQAGQKSAVGRIDVDTKRRANDLAKQVHINLPSDYAKNVADSQVLGLDLKILLDTHRLSVANKVGESLMQVEADALIATKKQEIMAIESLESWLVNTAEGREFLRIGGPQREAQRLNLGQLKAMLMQAEAAQTKAESYTPPFNPFGGESGGGGGGTGSGYNPNRTFNWDGTNALPVNPNRRFP